MTAAQSPVEAAAAQVYDLLLRRQPAEAMMLAGELLADATAQWRKAPGEAAAADMLVAACAMAEAQAAAGRFKPAINSALRALFAANAANAAAGVAAEPMMMCCLSAWNALEQLLTLTSPDEASRQAVADAARHLGSLLYRYYYAAGRANPDCPALADAYEALRVLSALVAIDPDAEPIATMHALAQALAAANLAE